MSVRSDTTEQKQQQPRQNIKQINEEYDDKEKIAHRTRLLQKQQEIAQEIKNVMTTSKDNWSICSTFDGLVMFSNNFMRKEYNDNSSYTSSVNSNDSTSNSIN